MHRTSCSESVSGRPALAEARQGRDRRHLGWTATEAAGGTLGDIVRGTDGSALTYCAASALRPSHPRQRLRRRPLPHPNRTRPRKHHPAAPIRHRPHPLPFPIRRLRATKAPAQHPSRLRLLENDSQYPATTKTRLSRRENKLAVAGFPPLLEGRRELCKLRESTILVGEHRFVLRDGPLDPEHRIVPPKPLVVLRCVVFADLVDDLGIVL